jgi:hypothetical protein
VPAPRAVNHSDSFAFLCVTDLLKSGTSDQNQRQQCRLRHDQRWARTAARESSYWLPPLGACEGRLAIMRFSGPGFFCFGSNIANPPRFEM